MATDFIMPRLPDQQQAYPRFYPHQLQQAQSPGFSSQPHYQSQISSQTATTTIQQPPPPQNPGISSQQISPLSTSNNASPTSPKSYHGRQLRPLYMPAVLRPNEHSAMKTPTKRSDDDACDGLKISSSFISLTGLGALGRLSRRSTGDSGKCMGSEWNLDLFPKPTAQPTRTHWKPDTESVICDEPSCMRHFNYFVRRHHCRRCGNIFCDPHSTFEVPLDQDANYNPRGTLARACSNCYNEFKSWRSRTNSQSSSDDGQVRVSHTAPTSPIASTPTLKNGPGPQKQAEVAASVPRDWNWSTF